MCNLPLFEFLLLSNMHIDAIPVEGGMYGRGSGQVLLDDLLCDGEENNLLECGKFNGSHSCDHSEDAGVRCEGKPTTESITCIDIQ